MTNKKEDTNILRLSASSMKTYDQCPLRYYYTYIEKVERKQWKHFDFGSLCHLTLEGFHKAYLAAGNKKDLSLSKLMTSSFSSARKEFKSLNKEDLKDAKKLLEQYLDSVKTDMPEVKGIEKSFNIKLSEQVQVRGFLDRLDVGGNKFHIVDYKTTKNTKYLEPFQLLVYGIWLNEEYPDTDEFDASYILLRHSSKRKTYHFNKADIGQCKKKIMTYAEDITNNTETKKWIAKPSILCNYCDFKDICSVNKDW